MLVKIVGEDAVQSRADARGAELAFAVARIGTTRAMVVMGVWALLEKGMFVWLEPQVLLQFVRLFPHPYSGCIIVCCIILLHLASQRVPPIRGHAMASLGRGYTMAFSHQRVHDGVPLS